MSGITQQPETVDMTAIDYGMLDSLKQTKASLSSVLQKFAQKLSASLDDVSSLEVETYVSDDLDGVKYDHKTKQFTGTLKTPGFDTHQTGWGYKKCLTGKAGGNRSEHVVTPHRDGETG